MRLQRKKDVNEILADSKSLTQYLEDVYEVEKNSVFCLSGKAENGSNHQPVRAGRLWKENAHLFYILEIFC
mgnify:CR=1 FL=1